MRINKNYVNREIIVPAGYYNRVYICQTGEYEYPLQADILTLRSSKEGKIINTMKYDYGIELKNEEIIATTKFELL